MAVKRLRIFWKLVKAAWEVSARSAVGLCICPDSCGAAHYLDPHGTVGWAAGLCWTCAHNEVCLRQALRRSRGEPF